VNRPRTLPLRTRDTILEVNSQARALRGHLMRCGIEQVPAQQLVQGPSADRFERLCLVEPDRGRMDTDVEDYALALELVVHICKI
jgi:hypothetical protein